MNKAKALFATGIIVIVAGVSAVCLYLNDSGKLNFGDNGDAVGNSEIVQDENYGNNSGDNADSDGNNSADVNTESDGNNIGDNNSTEDEKVDVTAVNEFLSTFSRVYFCNNSQYSEDDPDMYELLKFAYLYFYVYENGEGIHTEFFNDEIGYYNGMKADDAERIIEKFFGVGIKNESVYTEQTYQFFMYKDGYFYTPAADGVGYVNLSVVDTAVRSEDAISVSFTVYSEGVTCDMTSGQAKKNGTAYASGNAVIRITNDGYRLIDYSVKA